MASSLRPASLACLHFRTRRPFWAEVQRSRHQRHQELAAGEAALVRDRVLARQIQAAPPAMRELLATGLRPQVAPLAALRDARGAAVLFLMPTTALGDTVVYAGAIRELARHFGIGRLGVAFSGDAADVWGRLGRPVECFPLLLPEQALAGFDLVLDPAGEIPALDRVAEVPCAIDAAILRHLGLPEHYRWGAARPPRPIRRVALFPLSSTPLRTIPAALTRHLAAALHGDGLAVEVVVDPRTRQGAQFLAAAEGLGEVARLVPDLDTVDDLIRHLAEAVDYGIFCDSGPLHVTKLTGQPGFALMTTVAADAVLGGFDHLATWQAGYAGDWCRAPCGLVGAMSVGQGEAYGCMDRLRLPRERLVRPARLPDAATQALTEAPVACVAALWRDRDAILAAIRADIARRTAGAA